MSLHEVCRDCIRNITAWGSPCQHEFTCDPEVGALNFIPQTRIDQEDEKELTSKEVLANQEEALAKSSVASSGSSASYYSFPSNITEFQGLISFLNCNAQLGEIGRAWMRYGKCPHSSRKRDLEKIIFYAQAELERLVKYES